MRIVLDTNVLISGIFFTGTPHRILQAWAAGEFELVVSERLPTREQLLEAPEAAVQRMTTRVNYLRIGQDQVKETDVHEIVG